jgi:hypothetical protein
MIITVTRVTVLIVTVMILNVMHDTITVTALIVTFKFTQLILHCGHQLTLRCCIAAMNCSLELTSALYQCFCARVKYYYYYSMPVCACTLPHCSLYDYVLQEVYTVHKRAAAQSRDDSLTQTATFHLRQRVIFHNYVTNTMTGFFESVFSYVFGDGNPNANIEQQRLQLLASVIRSSGGTVTAEHLAPYLDDLPLFPGDVMTNGIINGQCCYC